MSAAPHDRCHRALNFRCRGLAVLTMGLALGMFVATRPGPREPSAIPHSLRIDPNNAPEGVLEALPRIGPVLAGRIIEEREESPFRNASDLDRRVRGVGPATLKAIRPHLRFDSNPDDAATSPDR